MRMPVGSTYELSDPDLEYSYAETCALLFQDLPDINADDVKRHLKEKNYGIHSLHQSVREKSHSLDIRNTLTFLIKTEGKESVVNTFEMMERTANSVANDCPLPDDILVMTQRRALPVLARCKTCGHEFITSPAALVQAQRMWSENVNRLWQLSFSGKTLFLRKDGANRDDAAKS